MIVPFIDSKAGAPIYVNPAYVVTMRPDPNDPDNASMIKTEDGECIKVRGDHRQVADKLSLVPAA
jgi:hypothetical protein